ncbi:hypothetical protein EDB83DRAFT_1179253 [Lactarius deliciosus]|nr:hypothetical protein EDB83DRAFT_1179253 [Lactarius deliciosus]
MTQDFNPWNQPFCPQTSVPSTVAPPSPTPCLGTKHQYALRGTKGNVRPWLSLILASRSPKPELLPLFVGKDVISGAVELDLPKPETIREVRIAPGRSRERVPTLPRNRVPFSRCHRPWQTHRGNSLDRFLIRSNLYSPKMLLFTSPTGPWFTLSRRGFTRKESYTSTTRLVVTVRRGKFSGDTSLVSDFCYFPETTAERPSTLREKAYLNPTQLDIPTPTLDPGGWKLLPSVKAVLVPNTAVTLQLSIANPLSFALGTPIPLFLEVRNSEATYFDPESIDIRLVRALVTRGLTGGIRKLDVARAVLWPAQGSSLHSTKLWGEIFVEKCLTPSFDFSNCTVRYSIVLYPRHTPDKSEREPLLSEEVLLTLHRAVGVVPRPQAPPGIIPQPIEHKRSVTTRSFFA